MLARKTKKDQKRLLEISFEQIKWGSYPHMGARIFLSRRGTKRNYSGRGTIL